MIETQPIYAFELPRTEFKTRWPNHWGKSHAPPWLLEYIHFDYIANARYPESKTGCSDSLGCLSHWFHFQGSFQDSFWDTWHFLEKERNPVSPMHSVKDGFLDCDFMKLPHVKGSNNVVYISNEEKTRLKNEKIHATKENNPMLITR